jgi:hypothetical protein
MAERPDATRSDDPVVVHHDAPATTGGASPVVASNGHAVAALVTGMLAATLGFLVIAAPAAILLGIAAIILGVMGVGRAKDWDGLLKGTAISGIVSGVLGLLLGLTVVVGGIALFDQAADDPAVQDQIDRLQQEIDRLSVEPGGS